MKKWSLTLHILMLSCFGWCGESISGQNGDYREICKKATNDPWYFENFRSLPGYAGTVEFEGGEDFADFLLKNASIEVLEKMNIFTQLDEIGNPSTHFFPGIGKFSAATLRYIVIAAHIKQLFSLPKNAKIVEIGAGFGGQIFILSQLQSFSKYYIYDLPEVEKLIEIVVNQLKVENVVYQPLENELSEESIDLFISNYAFSECERRMQLDYFERVIKKANRGYVIYNQIAGLFGIDYLSPDEFLNLLKQNGINPTIHNEPISTYPNNLLITWDNTKKY